MGNRHHKSHFYVKIIYLSWIMSKHDTHSLTSANSFFVTENGETLRKQRKARQDSWDAGRTGMDYCQSAKCGRSQQRNTRKELEGVAKTYWRGRNVTGKGEDTHLDRHTLTGQKTGRKTENRAVMTRLWALDVGLATLTINYQTRTFETRRGREASRGREGR